MTAAISARLDRGRARAAEQGKRTTPVTAIEITNAVTELLNGRTAPAAKIPGLRDVVAQYEPHPPMEPAPIDPRVLVAQRVEETGSAKLARGRASATGTDRLRQLTPHEIAFVDTMRSQKPSAWSLDVVERLHGLAEEADGAEVLIRPLIDSWNEHVAVDHPRKVREWAKEHRPRRLPSEIQAEAKEYIAALLVAEANADGPIPFDEVARVADSAHRQAAEAVSEAVKQHQALVARRVEQATQSPSAT